MFKTPEDLIIGCLLVTTVVLIAICWLLVVEIKMKNRTINKFTELLSGLNK